MRNIIEKKFFSDRLEIVLSSFIDNKQNVWFKGKDVAQILGYRDTKKAIKQHVSEENKIIQLISSKAGGYVSPPPPQVQQNETKGQKAGVDVSPPQVQQGRWYTFINEPGFYELAFSSKLKAAKKFRLWVFTTVLPSIRKYGYYKLFKDETRANQRVIIGGKHPVFTNHAASKNGEIVNVKTGKIKKMTNNGFGYLFFTLYNKKNGKT